MKRYRNGGNAWRHDLSTHRRVEFVAFERLPPLASTQAVQHVVQLAHPGAARQRSVRAEPDAEAGLNKERLLGRLRYPALEPNQNSNHATELADDRRVAAVAANAVAAIVAVLSRVGGGLAAAAV